MVGEDLFRGAAAHEVAVVAAPVVIAVQPGVGFDLELADGAEPATVERWSPAFLQGGALEAFAHRVVVGAAGRDPVVDDAELGEVVTEPEGDVFGDRYPTALPVSASRAGGIDAEPG